MGDATRLERRLDRALARAITPRGAAIVIATVSTVMTVGAGTVITVLDHENYPSVGSGLWWAAQTVTTVGYGDITPKNAPGKLVGALVMLQGIAFLAIITAAITSTFVARATAERDAAAQESEDRADELLDSRLVELSQRMDRLEQLLIKVNEGLPRARP